MRRTEGHTVEENVRENASDTSRRGFFVAIARVAAAVALAAVGAALAIGRGGEGTGERTKEDACLRMGVCRGCGRAEDCGLPQALSLREERKPMLSQTLRGAGKEPQGG